MGLIIFIGSKNSNQIAAVKVIPYKNSHKKELHLQPMHVTINLPGIAINHPKTHYSGQNKAWHHDAVIEFSLHNLESLYTDFILSHGVINEQSWQVKHSSHPRDKSKNMYCFNPEHNK